jgi:hypothetical protein
MATALPHMMKSPPSVASTSLPLLESNISLVGKSSGLLCSLQSSKNQRTFPCGTSSRRDPSPIGGGQATVGVGFVIDVWPSTWSANYYKLSHHLFRICLNETREKGCTPEVHLRDACPVQYYRHRFSSYLSVRRYILGRGRGCDAEVAPGDVCPRKTNL